MQRDFLSGLTTLSTVGELPGYDDALDVTARARELADLFKARPELPGALLTREGRLETAISRRYYLDTVGRYLGMDLYMPRPIEVMMSRFLSLGGALVLDHDVPVPEAVRRGLERRRELTYEPIVVRDRRVGGAGARLVDFESLLLADSRITELRGQQMRQILTTVQEGLVLVGPDRRLSPEYSAASERVLDLTQLGGRSFADLLAEGLDAERCELARDYLESLFDPRVIESLVVKVNPLLKVRWQRPGGRAKILAFRFGRGLDAGVIRRVLVRIEDVTRAEELAAEVEQERQRAETRLTLALAAVQVEPEVMDALLLALDRQRERALEMARRDEAPGREAIDALFRRVHALKGETGLLRLEAFQMSLHAVEEELVRWRDQGELRREALVERLASLAGLVGEVRQLRSRLSGAPGAAAETRAQPPQPGAARLAAALEELGGRVATDLGKQVALEVRLEPEALDGFDQLAREVLVQLVRNSIAHGIESAGDRLAAGKDATGLVQVVARRADAGGWIELVVQDDGRGLDFEAIRARGGDAAPELDESQLADLLFRPGFSTAAAPGEHAGRGVGLDLVRERVEAVGGFVEVHSEPGLLCAFRVLLPAPARVEA